MWISEKAQNLTIRGEPPGGHICPPPGSSVNKKEAGTNRVKQYKQFEQFRES